MAAVRLGHSCYNHIFELEQTTALDQVSTHLPQANGDRHRQHITTDLSTYKHMRQPHSPP